MSLLESMIEEKDLRQLNELGISEQQFEQQLKNFESEIKPLPLIKAAVVGDGILRYSDEERAKLKSLYRRFKDSLDIVKFVPASGAATRMFKNIYQGIEELKLNGSLNSDALEFVNNLKEYPFYYLIKSHFNSMGLDVESLIEKGEYLEVLRQILDTDKLDFGNLPKALIEFHVDNQTPLTSLEEHFIELINYANTDGQGRLHITASIEHLDKIKAKCKELKKKYSSDLAIKVEFSIQKKSTNIVAVNSDNSPVRLEDGSMMFRPGGHGALLNNLNEIRAQLIFIKNIDNVSKQSLHSSNAEYKELLAGRLLEMRENIHNLLNGLIHEQGREKASKIIFDRWGLRVETEEEIKEVLDRPIRVCGMVKNTGAPGGGPFWVEESDGSRGMQIVESSQIDMSDKNQKLIFENSTHFNPVDVVCWVEDHSGVKFDLMKYRDETTGFISEKSFKGKPLKAQEFPGLWNGSMAHWITEFVEVPLHTFNPVKSVSDLLSEGHR